jgi:AbrB family looped-hinge helix DNA binding protein
MNTLQDSPYHEFESTVSPKGQITLPSLSRRKLGLKARDKVKIRVFDDGKMLVEPSKGDIFSHYRTAPALKEPLTMEEMREIAYAEAYKEKIAGA